MATSVTPFSSEEKDKISGKKPSLSERLKEHGENSNLHGISHILNRRTAPRRVCWILAFLACTGFACYLLFNVYFLYISYPTQTSVTIRFKPQPFPHVTLCNMNPVRLSKTANLSDPVLKTILLSANLSAVMENYTTEYSKALSYYHDFLDGNTNKDLVFNENFFIEQLHQKTMESLSYEEKYEISHQVFDLLMECHYHGFDCMNNREITSYTSTLYGVCHTINTTGFVAATSGPVDALTLLINLETYETLPSTNGYGIVLSVHADFDPEKPENKGFVLSGGTETHVRLRLTNILKKGHPYSKCKTVFPSGDVYTFETCLAKCVNKQISYDCNCLYEDMDDVEVKPRCHSNAEASLCAKQMYGQIYSAPEKYCDCPPACSESIYTTSVSTRKWPTANHRKKLMKTVCDLKEICPFDNMTTEKLESNFMMIKIYFEDLNYQIIKEEPVYDAIRLLSDVGGSVGLCIGFSLLCVMELLEVLLDVLIMCCHKIHKKFSS